MSCGKFLFIFAFACAAFSCAARNEFELSAREANNSVADSAPQKIERVPVDSSQTSGEAKESWFEPQNPIYRSPFQSRPRRNKIDFPDDCTDQVGAGEKARPLPKSCIEAIRKIHKDLENAAEAECSHPINDFDNHPYPVIDDEKILSYTIKNEKETGISVLEEKLGTVYKSFDENNALEYPVELKIGQTLKYQKAHYSYSFAPKFYPLEANEYLVEILCDAGAYNLYNLYLFYDESKLPAKAKLLRFPYLELEYANNLNDYDESQDIPDKINRVTVPVVHGRWFNRKTKELIVFVKAHGIGDAGRYARYSFPNGKPKLEEFRARIIWSGRGYQVYDVLKSPPKTWKRYFP